MKFSIMTMQMLLPIIEKYRKNGDLEMLQTEYDCVMAMVSQAGYTRVDVMDLEAVLLDREFIKDTLEKYNLSVGCYLHMPFCAQVRDRCVEDALYFGTSVLMLVPQPPEEAADMTEQQVHEAFAAKYRSVLTSGLAAGLHVVVEDDPNPDNHMGTQAQLAHLLQCLPGLEVVYDSGNMLIAGEDPVAYYHRFRVQTAHIHFKDMAVTDADISAFPGEGLVDLPAVAQAILESGYTGIVTVEFIPKQGVELLDALKESLEYARGVFQL